MPDNLSDEGGGHALEAYIWGGVFIWKCPTCGVTFEASRPDRCPDGHPYFKEDAPCS